MYWEIITFTSIPSCTDISERLLFFHKLTGTITAKELILAGIWQTFIWKDFKIGFDFRQGSHTKMMALDTTGGNKGHDGVNRCYIGWRWRPDDSQSSLTKNKVYQNKGTETQNVRWIVCFMCSKKTQVVRWKLVLGFLTTWTRSGPVYVY
jgi:hypothetical protein